MLRLSGRKKKNLIIVSNAQQKHQLKLSSSSQSISLTLSSHSNQHKETGPVNRQTPTKRQQMIVKAQGKEKLKLATPMVKHEYLLQQQVNRILRQKKNKSLSENTEVSSEMDDFDGKSGFKINKKVVKSTTEFLKDKKNKHQKHKSNSGIKKVMQSKYGNEQPANRRQQNQTLRTNSQIKCPDTKMFTLHHYKSQKCSCCGKKINKLCFHCKHIYCSKQTCERKKKQLLNSRMLEQMRQDRYLDLKVNYGLCEDEIKKKFRIIPKIKYDGQFDSSEELPYAKTSNPSTKKHNKQWDSYSSSDEALCEARKLQIIVPKVDLYQSDD